MTRFLPKLYLDFSSFWAGIILVVILTALYLRFRKRIHSFVTRTGQKLIDFRETLSISSDADYIQVLYKYSQSLHIAADYFPLESILVSPFCQAPPPVFFPGKVTLETSLVQQTIGYDPWLPEIASEYFSPCFPLVDAVYEDLDLCLLGHAGTGKTTAIAACLSQLIEKRSQQDQVYQRIPFYIKSHDLLAQFPDSNIVGILLKAVQSNKAFQAIPNFSKYFTATIQSGKAVLFLDDIDLLPYSDVNRIANFIGAVRASFPELQIVAAAAPSNLGSLTTAGLEFLPVQTWGDSEKYTFLNKLSESWPHPPAGQEMLLSSENSVRQAMLVVSDSLSTPLEFTLKALAAYAGDIMGPTASQAIASYLKRALPDQEEIIRALEIPALYCLESQKSTFTRRDLNAWMADFYGPNSHLKPLPKLPSFSVIIQAGLDGGILDSAAADEYYFSFSTIAGYLAARGSAALEQRAILNILESPDWSLMHETMRFFASFNDIKPYLKLLLDDQSVMRNKVVRASQWLSGTRHSSPEEMALLKALTQEINNSPLYLTKLRLVCALARSSNPTVASIFQHLLTAPTLNTRRAAAVGCGLIRDLSAVPRLIRQLNDAFPSNTAACYALGRIGSPRSLEAIAEALLQGTELLRRAAAESLAQNRSEGHPALREGATREDLLVRYAVVHGLSLIREDWSLEILDRMRIDEKEWVVRDLAQQSYDILRNRSPYLPVPCPPPQKAAWLAEFAVSQGLPEPNAENALEYLLKALREGAPEQKQNSLAHLARTGKADQIPDMVKAATQNRTDIALQAELAIWLTAPQRYQFRP